MILLVLREKDERMFSTTQRKVEEVKVNEWAEWKKKMKKIGTQRTSFASALRNVRIGLYDALRKLR